MNKRWSTLVTAMLLATTLGWQQPLATVTAAAKTTTTQTTKKPKRKTVVSTSTHIKLQGASNARDLGGYVNSKGQKIKIHRLIRSNSLSTLTKADQKKLVKTYHLATDVDLRTISEQKQSPDVRMKGVKLVKANVFKEFPPLPDFSKKNAANKMMEKTYHDAVTTAQGRKAYKSLFHQLLINPKNKAVLWHCSAGKDRAGMGTAFVLSALDFSRAAITKDYLKSNAYLVQTNKVNLQKEEAGWKAQGKTLTPTVIANFKDENGVQKAYLNAMYKAIDVKYGSMSKFLHKGLGLTNAQLKQLQANYLTPAK
ncbi:tyrosine-protein phosphatase [Levilactobacillus koreensis]|uniref:Protein tyrosine phosphatase n=1 Tax=Levilactobacillus koreensis TaxID=637971 RepID=A0AAC8UTM8_9LACO|nr:tyrosine-protein phosphatase [Levilactobacillus koreensis]AKP64130.1 protein tyrosine phosphatase [Levilactobacillus koreensis]